jgi:hypothetical protein
MGHFRKMSGVKRQPKTKSTFVQFQAVRLVSHRLTFSVRSQDRRNIMSESTEQAVAQEVATVAKEVETVAVADFKALVARVEALEPRLVALESRAAADIRTELTALETKVKAALTHIGVDVKLFFKKL